MTTTPADDVLGTDTASDTGGHPAFPFGRTCPFAPNDKYQSFSDDNLQKVDFKGTPGWLVTGYNNVRTVLADPRMSVRGIDDSSRGDDGEQAVPGFFVAMDPPQHDDLRRILAKEFTPRRMAAMRPTIERIANDLIDEILKSDEPVDIIDALALPLPSLVICELLGVPYDRHDFFQERTRAVLAAGSTPEQVGAAIGDVMTYLAELVTIKQENPGDDLVSLLVKHIESGDLSVIDVAGMSTFLLMAGHETTGNMIGLGLFALLEHPDQLAELREDPELMPQAVEELLRHLDIIGSLPRTATEDLEIDGQRIAKGELLMFSTEAGNRDPSVFDEPNHLDFHRDASRHLTFGHGIHTCLGAPLARLELQVVYSLLLERIPSLRLAVPASDIKLKNDARIFGVHELPIMWDRP
ncbi:MULTISPECIES: cytochrome P450 [Rhodococcus]|uniref:Cytochrome P450 n=1 Tax=Rhodococcus oxybenzonivorans TaxID=1990687 RepID=A0AAE4V734_9NOCA|nr:MULTISPECIES: cytochrome P450 [Rhodococcus]MDV7242708.1 cytochrome P450 [Rhodococcus oxybenzonivorans]MDV7269013.1 cytochrome P450 [Rhodococcus oxybenzonivorans]MDV7276141.1 cytochrome P450 [Rhodococcus oxybenzonivorans]MDV7332196.1 cytochrome P450 [Rhodococcus oxybenzonivorans]MDV7344401.1 cytochrome P450 [Rhodococcus oxybenzonivorans]